MAHTPEICHISDFDLKFAEITIFWTQSVRCFSFKNRLYFDCWLLSWRLVVWDLLGLCLMEVLLPFSLHFSSRLSDNSRCFIYAPVEIFPLSLFNFFPFSIKEEQFVFENSHNLEKLATFLSKKHAYKRRRGEEQMCSNKAKFFILLPFCTVIFLLFCSFMVCLWGKVFWAHWLLNFSPHSSTKFAF